MQCWPAQTAIHSNSYTNTHRPTRHPPLDKQCRSAIIISTTVLCHLKDPEETPVGDRVPPCHIPHANNTSFNSKSQRSRPTPSHHGPARRCPPDDYLHRQPPRQSAVCMVICSGWCGSDFNVVACCLLFFTKLILAICQRQFADVLACSDVADF